MKQAIIQKPLSIMLLLLLVANGMLVWQGSESGNTASKCELTCHHQPFKPKENPMLLPGVQMLLKSFNLLK